MKIGLDIACSAKNYCGSNYCNNTKQHTLCRYQNSDPARHCVEYEKTIRTAKEKQAILDKLNSRRNKVAGGEIRSLPSAENMMKLEWNEELELSAQRWANQCVKHSSPDIKDTCRDLGSMPVGQNIATIYGEAPGLTPLALVDVWYMELLNVNASVLPRYKKSKDAGYSHYDYFTQLVWAKSNQVGCGGVKFKERLQDLGNDKKRAVYRLVCNFAPAGNVVNQTVYDDGPPCSRCPDETCDSVYKALCVRRPPPLTTQTERIEFELTTNIFRRKDHKAIKLPEKTTDIEDEDFITPFDYLKDHMHDFVRPALATTTKKVTSKSCKDTFAIDDFVELLKNKLSTDPMFKDLLQSSPTSTEHADNGFTDALALIGKIYSKTVASPTTQAPNRDYVNSTLLVDLVEAVIFRNSDKPKITQDMLKFTLPEIDVSPVKIQAELAQIKENADFTGHLFFPEDVEDSEHIDTTEVYDEATNPSLPEHPYGDLRRSKVTKDFLDEILDSDIVTETLYHTLYIQMNQIK
ncbi:cysteine-rich secretory protein family domain-containing protein [Phthorimaea operculella]|nr:cysteine-rich secretory protein family domain-containing protein [Phthorimaea operculella]